MNTDRKLIRQAGIGSENIALRACDLCGGQLLETPFGKWQFENSQFEYLQCVKCGLVVCDPIPSEQQLRRLYSNYYNYDWYRKSAAFKKVQAWHRYRRVMKITGGQVPAGSRILDVGCGHGYFLDVMAKHGFNSYGFDYASDPRGLESKQHIMYSHSLDDLQENGFALITAWHSLEHMRDPIRFLHCAKRKLNPGGLILIAVPNFACVGRRIRGRWWVWMQQPFVHLRHFNPYNLRCLFVKSGITVQKIWTVETWDAQVYDWGVDRALNVLRRLLRQSDKEWFFSSELLRLATTPLSYLLSGVVTGPLKVGSELIVIGKLSD